LGAASSEFTKRLLLQDDTNGRHRPAGGHHPSGPALRTPILLLPETFPAGPSYI
jgi:hypothetical protein